MGCVRITEQFLDPIRPRPRSCRTRSPSVRDLVADVPRVIPGATEAATLVGLAGTVTTVAAIELGIPEYDPEQIHHFVLTRAAAEDVFRTLATETAEQRAHNPGLEPGRVDVIVGGTRCSWASSGCSDSRRCWSARPTSSTVWCAASCTGCKATGAGKHAVHRGWHRPVNPPTRPPVVPRMSVMDLTEFDAALKQLTADDIHDVARSLASDTAGDEVDAWHATIAIDRALRHSHRTRHAARAAWDAGADRAARRRGERHGSSPTTTSRTWHAPRPRSRAA